MIEQAFATRDSISSLSQHEVDETFGIQMRLMELNYQLDAEDIREEDEQRAIVEREHLVEELLQTPTASFNYKFSLLQLMYENRTYTSTDSLGTTSGEFVTRSPQRDAADLHFREIHYAGGSVERVVEVPTREPAGLPFFVSVKDGDLRIACSVYERGNYHRREVAADSTTGEKLLGDFLRHTIVAGDFLSTRKPNEVAEADRQAKRFLTAKKIADVTLS